jgi:acyl carrier protein
MAGEPIPPRYLEQLDATRIEIRNLYGPSEDTTYSTVYRLQDKGEILVGKPISNTRIYILGDELQLQPVGVAGEICIAGDGLAKGYLNQPELTAAKFVANPFRPGERLYRTGDIGRWLPDGNIAYLGRKDDQVKIRGYRIELGEIERALMKYPDIAAALVMAKATPDGGKELVAYLVGSKELNPTDIRTYLVTVLPAYMAPAHFIQLEALPLNQNGKVDRKKLPDPAGLGVSTSAPYVAPGNEIEEKLVLIWQELLHKERIGIRDNFFELGGHSLKVAQLLSRINLAFEVRINIQNIFKDATIENIGGQIYFLLEQNKHKQNRSELIQIDL